MNKNERMDKTEKLRVFEAFAGVGMQHMGLKKAGLDFEVVGIAEIDKYAIASYKAIHGDVVNFGDISKINAEELPEFDLFTYSFPCQDISLSGYQRGCSENSNTRSSLLWECKKIIEAKKPRFLLLENVKNLVGKDILVTLTFGLNIWLHLDIRVHGKYIIQLTLESHRLGKGCL